ncbi:hypothetical protein DIPPA_18700 [Diplonema papillatum]|nr:hypothetical protein DIPPA_18700 [Diplonema papillatum]
MFVVPAMSVLNRRLYCQETDLFLRKRLLAELQGEREKTQRLTFSMQALEKAKAALEKDLRKQAADLLKAQEEIGNLLRLVTMTRSRERQVTEAMERNFVCQQRFARVVLVFCFLLTANIVFRDYSPVQLCSDAEAWVWGVARADPERPRV